MRNLVAILGLVVAIAGVATACGGSTEKTSSTEQSGAGGASAGQGGNNHVGGAAGLGVAGGLSGEGGNGSAGASGSAGTEGTAGNNAGSAGVAGSAGTGGTAGNNAGSAGVAGSAGTGGTAGSAGSGGSGACSPGSVRSCGSSNVGECRYGQESCVPPGTWSGTCQNNIEPAKETCDGRDEDCDGHVDNGTFLPNSYDASEWLPSGFLGLQPGVFLAWGHTGAVWDRNSAKITLVKDLANIWALGSGSQPPNANIDSITFVPNGTFGKTSDLIWVTAGPNLYVYDDSTKTWSNSKLQDEVVKVSRVTSALVLFKGDIGLTEDTLFFTSGSKMYSWSVSAGRSAPRDIDDVLCPSGTQGTCPPGVTSMSRFKDQYGTLGLLVGYQDKTYFSPLVPGQPFSWSTIDMSSISCAH